MTWAFETAVRTLWQEARGEPPEGREAVAHTIKNRLSLGKWGHSLASVCLWPKQFSGWNGPSDPNFKTVCLLDDNDATLSALRGVMEKALDGGADPTKGATHYYADYIAAPFWTKGATFCGKFGNQLFYKDVP